MFDSKPIQNKNLNSSGKKTVGNNALLSNESLNMKSKSNVRAIPIAHAKIYPIRDRSDYEYSRESLADLMESITTSGQLQPIIVVRKKGIEGIENNDLLSKIDCDYFVIAGARRFNAAKHLAHVHIDATIIDEASEESIIKILETENAQRKDRAYSEIAKFYYFASLRFTSATQTKLSEIFGKPTSSLSRYLKVGAVLASNCIQKMFPVDLISKQPKRHCVDLCEIYSEHKDNMIDLSKDEDFLDDLQTARTFKGKLDKIKLKLASSELSDENDVADSKKSRLPEAKYIKKRKVFSLELTEDHVSLQAKDIGKLIKEAVNQLK